MKSWFNFLLALVVLGNQIWFQPSLISPASNQPAPQAQTIATPTAPSSFGAYPPPTTPTPIPTTTPIPTVTPVPTTTPTPPVTSNSQERQGIQLAAEPAIYIPGQPIMLSLSVNLTQSKAKSVEMSIKVPDGIHATNKTLDATIDANRILKASVNAGEKSNHSFSWNVDDTIAQPPFVFSVAITQSDGSTLTSNSVVIGAGQYQAEPGSEKKNALNTPNNTVNLSVPGDAIDHSLAFDVRGPSENKMPPYSLSGDPVEIIAVDKTTAKNVTKFKKPLTLTMKYDPEVF